MPKGKILRLVLGDQLNHGHSWWDEDPKNVVVALVESKTETGYVRHHIQKVIAFFLSMRNFTDFLENKGFEVRYIKINDDDNAGSIPDNIKQIVSDLKIQKFEYQLPDEYRLDRALKSLCNDLDIETQAVDTEHFLTERKDLKEFFEGKKTYLMESFYRMMRKKYDILMDGDEPAKGKWNFDKQNRKSLPKNHKPEDPRLYKKDVSDLVEVLKDLKIETIGKVDPENFIWPVSREESLDLLNFFIDKCLDNFGDYQDAMAQGEWSVYHSRLSFAMNSKMLSPLEVVQAVEDAWHKDSELPISSIEGFIRQIIGWREYMRGVYWAKMPNYKSLNYFDNKRKLPKWFWDGKTKMNCQKEAVGQSLNYAYAHHIQRLMITGNFALLAGIDPDDVDEWYLGIYIDAIEWVEITNTRGMSQFADGGIVGTKPYVSSANYIDKMSDYCKDCHYSKTKKTGDGACPFNSLFWNFYQNHRDKLENNPRIGFVYRTLDKMNDEKKSELFDQAEFYLKNINDL
jgi:deoxyribodipyrimidine photolyase-related protein